MRQDMNEQGIDLFQGKILIVDDEASNIAILMQMLQYGGYLQVFATQDPTETIPLCERHAIDLVLLDLNMPVLDGFAVMDAIKTSHLSKMPIILVLTGRDIQTYRQRALDSGARDYVTKPCDLDELLSRVRNLLEMKLLQNALQEQNARLEQLVEQRTWDLIKTQRNLHNTRLQVVRRLGRAAEYRDNETGYHIIRMSQIAELLGRAAGLDNDECDLLLNASPMHDLGKIGIPDHILLKPGKLNSEEWNVMQTHVKIGADILAGDDSDLLAMARTIVLTHHEKWNGTGYPKGLAGEAIPLVGRISALADVFDALICERPYKQAWSAEEAVNYIQQQSGLHFDPSLVELFTQNLPKILAIKARYEVQDNTDALEAVDA